PRPAYAWNMNSGHTSSVAIGVGCVQKAYATIATSTTRNAATDTATRCSHVLIVAASSPDTASATRSSNSSAAIANGPPPNFTACQTPAIAPMARLCDRVRVSGGVQSSARSRRNVRSSTTYADVTNAPTIDPGMGTTASSAAPTATATRIPAARRST